jgi:hypothetical protein
MLPPIDNSVLQSNPQFATLHANLTNNILNPSGSTKNHPAQKDRDAVTEVCPSLSSLTHIINTPQALKTARIRAAKRQLIRSALCEVDISSAPHTSTKSRYQPETKQKPPLPTELLELILLLSSYLTTPLPASSTKLLTTTSQWTSLPTHLPKLGSLLSTHLQTQALALARILSPTTNPSFLHRNIPKLEPNILTTQKEISVKKLSLAARRSTLVTKTTTVLGNYHAATTLIIQHLEQSKHGAIARHIKCKSEFLALTAQQVNLDVKDKTLKGDRIVYTEEVKQALSNYVREMRDGRERLGERKRGAERTLWGYGVGREDSGEKEKVMREIARVYGELCREVREVGRDVERLRGR